MSIGLIIIFAVDLDCRYNNDYDVMSLLLCLSLISLIVFGGSVTNLNEPARALATSTIAWVRN